MEHPELDERLAKIELRVGQAYVQGVSVLVAGAMGKPEEGPQALSVMLDALDALRKSVERLRSELFCELFADM